VGAWWGWWSKLMTDGSTYDMNAGVVALLWHELYFSPQMYDVLVGNNPG
jgi:hypothetical protein